MLKIIKYLIKLMEDKIGQYIVKAIDLFCKINYLR